MLRIKEFRKAKKMTAKQLADQVNVAESTMCLYENGKRTPDYKTLYAISNELDITVQHLLGEIVSSTYNRVKSIRIFYKETISEFAKKINVSEETIRKWESNSLNVDLDSISNISEIYNVPVKFVEGFSFHLKWPTNVWSTEDEKDYNQALKNECEDVILFKIGDGFFDESDIKKEKPADEGELSEFEKTLLVMFRQIPEEQQKAFLEMGRLFANSHKKD